MFYENFKNWAEISGNSNPETEFWARAKTLAQEWVEVENSTKIFDFQGLENTPKVQNFLKSRALDCLFNELNEFYGYMTVEDRFDLPGIDRVELEVILTPDWKPVLRITD